MIVNLPNPSTLIIQGGPEIGEWRETLEVRQPGFQFTDAFKKRYWDGYIRPGKLTVNGSYYKLIIGRGFLNPLREFLKENGYASPKYRLGFQAVDQPDLGRISPDIWAMLRDYQRESLERGAKHRWGRIALATNAGKGAVIALMAQVLTPHKTLILADEVSVFQALQEELSNWTDVDIGIVKAGRKDLPKEKVVLGMVPTIHKRISPPSKKQKDTPELKALRKKWKNWLLSFKALLLDEADRSTSDRWKKILWGCKNTEFRLGFSGSFPEGKTVENLRLSEQIGPELISIKNIELVERGISAKPKIHIHRFRWDIDTKEELSLHEVYEEHIINNEKRNKLIRALLLQEEPNAIVINYLEHGRALNEIIPNSVFLKGEDSDSKRLDTLKRFQKGEFNTLITTKILDRGSNLLGYVKNLILASGSGSNKEVLQRMGRGLRRGGGKKEILIQDIFDYGHDYLTTASERRLDVYRKEGFEIKMFEIK